MDTTTRHGLPKFTTGDFFNEANLAAQIDAIDGKLQDFAMTDAERDALAGAGLWDGRLAFITDTETWEWYDADALAWKPIADSSALNAHINDAEGAHPSTAISHGAGSVSTELGALGTAISDHLADTDDAHDASAISYAGSTNLAATNVEAALDELDAEKAATGAVTPRTLAVTTKTAAYTVTDSDDVILCNGTFTVTLPAAATRTGRVFYIKNIGSGTVTIDPNAAETIDGDATHAIAVQHESRTVISDGAGWRII